MLLTAVRVAIIRHSSFRDIKFSNDSKDEWHTVCVHFCVAHPTWRSFRYYPQRASISQALTEPTSKNGGFAEAFPSIRNVDCLNSHRESSPWEAVVLFHDHQWSLILVTAVNDYHLCDGDDFRGDKKAMHFYITFATTHPPPPEIWLGFFGFEVLFALLSSGNWKSHHGRP